MALLKRCSLISPLGTMLIFQKYPLNKLNHVHLWYDMCYGAYDAETLVEYERSMIKVNSVWKKNE